MKTTRILTVLVVALAMIFFWLEVSEAASLGTAFTYQGQLMDKNKPADGPYSFQFKLYDSNDPCTGVQLGSPIDINDLDVIDGHFIVELDFGSGIFDGNAVWLETRVVESPMGSEPATLSPLLELTPTPYALYATKAAAVPGGTTNYIPKFLQGNKLGNSVVYEANGNIGIGTTEPDEKLHVVGSIKIVDDSQGANKVLTSDANGVASWQNLQILPGGVPSGVIVMWSGTIDGNGNPVVDGTADSNWQICDGTNGTPDLRDRFIVGAGSSYSIGAAGGEASHTLTVAEMPSHSHELFTSLSGGGGGCWYPTEAWDTEGPKTGTQDSGGGQPHENRPPYYALAYIMKL